MKKLLKNKQAFINPANEVSYEELHKLLDKHLENKGYPIGVENIMDLDETGFAEARNNTFGASDSSVLLQVAYSSKSTPMKTRDTLLYEKVNNVWDEEIGKLASVRKGKELEDMIIHKFEKLLNINILKPNHMYINKKGLATNFDGVAFLSDEKEGIQPIPFEIKLCSFFGRKNYNWNRGMSEFSNDLTLLQPEPPEISELLSIQDHIINSADYYGIPKYYYTQLQQQIMFLDAPYGLLGVMDDINWEIYVYVIHKDEKVIKKLGIVSLEYYLKLCKQKGLPMDF